MKFRTWLGLFTALALGLTAIIALQQYRLLFTPYQKVNSSGMIEVPYGASVRDIADILYSDQWIPSVTTFKLLTRLTHSRGPIRAGEYELTSDLSPWQILMHLREGDVVLHKVTIPEGLRSADAMAIVAQRLPLSEDRLVKLLTDPEWIRSLGLDIPSLEGYLLPETYSFPKTITEEEVIGKMVREMLVFFDEEKRHRAMTLGLSLHQVLTLASIIEKEMGVTEEGPLISSVYHNRLKRNMLLQSDPTVIYGIDDFDGDIRWRDLRKDTPYNTYTRSGLPPTPIANPGKRTIEAALFPSETSYLYFVSKNDKTHVFSKTLAEHNRAVNQYQRRRHR
jgi:UPF0755 protein